MIGGLITGLVSGSLNGSNFELSIPVVFLGFLGGLIGGLIGTLIGGLKGSEVPVRERPGLGFFNSLKNSLIIGLIVGLFCVVMCDLLSVFGLFSLINDAPIIGSIYGLLFALNYGGGFVIHHMTCRLILYHNGHIPWNLVAFLDYCTDHIFLRRVGGGYIFIHRMLMEHFAAMKQDEVDMTV